MTDTLARKALRHATQSGLTPKQIREYFIKQPGTQWALAADMFHFPDGSKIVAEKRFQDVTFKLVE